MSSAQLHAIGPLDGRYRGRLDDVASHFSEYAYIKHRVEVEIEYFIALISMLPPLKELAMVKPEPALLEKLRKIYTEFKDEDAAWVKQTEFKGGAVGGPPLATNHDVKAVEYFLKHRSSSLLADGTGPRRSLSLKLSDPRVYEPQMRLAARYLLRERRPRLGAELYGAVSERVLYGQPTGPSPLYHRDDLVDRPRAMGV